MAKIEEILKLIEAGYKKNEIDQMMAEVPAAETVPEPAEDPAPVQPDESIPEEQPKGDNSEMMSKLAEEIAELRKQIQKRNLSDTYMETPKKERSQDILASLINPIKEEKK